MLRIANLVTAAGQVEILKGVSLHVQEGETVALIGANGAGKSTLLNTIAGLASVREGELELDGRSLRGLSPEAIVRRGISLVPEGRQLFSSMSVDDNLLLGAYHRYCRRCRDDVARDRETILSLFPILRKRNHQLAGTLSGGEQQMLAIARALMAKPKLLLLDEPSIGLAPKIVEEIFSVIQELKQNQLTVMLVEQNAKLALEFADRAYVIETGQVVMEGDAAELRENSEVKRAYLGKEYQEIWE